MTFNSLPEQVWPRTTERIDGEIYVGGVCVPTLVQRYGSPLFIVDEQDFRSRCRDMADAFGAHNVHYASKAFLTPAIVQWVHEEGLHMDVASEGEFRVARHGGFPASDITAHGNNKSLEFLKLLVEEHVGCIVVDSHQELDRLAELTKSLGIVQDVLIRVKPGIEAHTHEFIATSHEDQKFGFSLASGSAYQAAKRAIAASHLRLVGLHCHVGSQVFDAEGFSLAAERVLGLWRRILSDEPVGEEFHILDLGGGYGIAYMADERPLDVQLVAKDLLTRVQRSAEELGVATPRVTVEPGRAIAGPSTITAYTAGTIKDVHVTDDHLRRYVAVDGGMSDNIRPALYQAEYDIRLANRETTASAVSTRVVGSHCESGDILIDSRELPADIVAGDILAVAATGAYCYAMSSRYNMMMRPAVVSVKDGQARVMMRAETIEDFLNLAR
ncbi:diaminopimelate decarboxylase [Corynebacterium kutscheri]|nr:diaminopimelate decarboxylase [Corynebacterium kutscheri]AKE41654.1 diaminopimelate decarboxylase [Corynebacterium kutscheri]